MEPLLEPAARVAALLLMRRIAVGGAKLGEGRDWALTQWALT